MNCLRLRLRRMVAATAPAMAFLYSGAVNAQAVTPSAGAADTPVKSQPSDATVRKSPAGLLPLKEDAKNNALQTIVHLNLGETTVQKLAQALSVQTGQTVQAEEALRERRLLVQMEAVSARDALDTLVECNEWRWFRNEEGVFWIARRRPALPRKTADLPAALSAVLPPDYRRFFGVNVPPEELPPVLYLNSDGKQVPLPPNNFPSEWKHRERISARLANLRKRSETRLLQEFPFADSPNGAFVAQTKTFPFQKMTAQQQTLVNEAFLSNLLEQFATEQYVWMLYAGLNPHEIDVNVAKLKLVNGNNFEIGSDANKTHYAFGMPIPSLKATPDPSRPPLRPDGSPHPPSAP